MARRWIYAETPDVLILDLDADSEEKLELCRDLKADPFTYARPIVFCLAERKAGKELNAVEAGADDFLYKPIELDLMVARIEMTAARVYRLQTANPLTGLPGGPAIDAKLKELIELGAPLAVAYCDLDDFKAFNDHYGYSRGDNVIRVLATIIKDALDHHCGNSKGTFCGHIGGDDFIFVVDHHCVEKACEYILGTFAKLIPFQYDPPDRERGYIVAKDRQNREFHFPFMTISIGVVTNRRRVLLNPVQVADLCTEMKRYAKSRTGNVYVIDRRTD
jgi:PleD family two-component response regulator